MDAYYKIPRLYLNSSFSERVDLLISDNQAHYLKNVLRKQEGDSVRVFNGSEGEWIADITVLKKRSGHLMLRECIREQTTNSCVTTLYFAPLAKTRLYVLIEKAVEIGVSRLVPVITNRTEHRKVNLERMRAHIIEAAEQCERLDIPDLDAVCLFHECLDKDLFVCFERSEHVVPINTVDFPQNTSFLVGPPGGFDDQEREVLLSKKNIKLLSLGENILRTETAALAALSFAILSNFRK